MSRLNDMVLSLLSVYICPEDHITIALLNVQSLLPKVPDIKCDQLFTSAMIHCFTETWLQSELESPVIHTKPISACIRLDRASGDRKGAWGFDYSLPSTIPIELIEYYSFEQDDVQYPIEIMCAVLGLPNGKHIHLTLHGLQISNCFHKSFLNTMRALLSHLY